MKKKREETYQLTFKGFVTLMINDDTGTDRFLDALELWLRRCEKNAVILNKDTGGFDTAKVYLEDK